MKKRNLKTEKLTLKKMKISKIENLNAIKGGRSNTGTRSMICVNVR